MPEIRFDYSPLPIHEAFHRSTAPERCLFGAFGSGKTYALCAEAIAMALEQPGSRILICRKTIPELRDTTETVFMDIMPTELFNACTTSRMGGHFEKIVFPNGSTVLFRGIDDWQKHKSLNVCGIFYDEADEFDEETITGMASRVRQRDPTREAKALGAGEIRRRATCFAANPAGHNWLYKMFVDPKSRRQSSEWFKSTSFDNPFLPVDYLERLLSYPEPWVKRFVLALGSDEPVLTPGGWKRIGSIKVGDEVIGSGGRPTKVRAVHPQGIRKLYRVTSSDGGSVLCDASHRWTVGRLDQSKENRGGTRWVTVPTSELRGSRKRGERRDRLPSLPPVEYPEADLPIDPYILGCLLGDGTWSERSVGFAWTDSDKVEAFRKCFSERFQYRDGRRCAWIRDPDGALRGALRDLGLMGAKAPTKFVPETYLRASVEQRLALLQGLMDTDGHGGNTANHYVTVSPLLAQDVLDLARSLGCRASCRRRPPCKGGNYERFDVLITPPTGTPLFRLSRKQTFWSCRGAQRYVKSVEYEGEGDATCITVEADDGLFVTKDHLVTHNCQFDDFAGQIYEEWDWDTHVIEEPVAGWPKGSVYWMGMDPGTRNPTAGLWVVLDTERRRLVGIAEYEDGSLAAKYHADAWRKLERQHKMNVKVRKADPSIMTRDRGTNMSLHTQYQRLGFNFQLGPKLHKDRIPALGQLIHTGQFVVTKRCMLTYEAIKNYKWEDLTPAQRARGDDPKETPLKRNDHLVDCAQYIASNWIKPLDIKAPGPDLSDAEHFGREATAAIRKKIAGSSRPTLSVGTVI